MSFPASRQGTTSGDVALITNGGTWCRNLREFQLAEVMESMTASELRNILTQVCITINDDAPTA